MKHAQIDHILINFELLSKVFKMETYIWNHQIITFSQNLS